MSNHSSKERRGGARPGAGRKSEDKKQVATKLAPDVINMIDVLKKETNLPKAQIIESAVREYFRNALKNTYVK